MKFSIFQNFKVRQGLVFGKRRYLLTFDHKIDHFHFQVLLGGTLNQTHLNTKCFPHKKVWVQHNFKLFSTCVVVECRVVAVLN